MPKPTRVRAACKPLVLEKLTTARGTSRFGCQLSTRQESNFLDSDTLRKFKTKGFASPFSVDRPTNALVPPVLLFFITSTSAITSKTLNSCRRIQTVCQTLVIKWD